MKSLLVDALRQLEEGESPAETPAPAAGELAAPDELELATNDAAPAPARTGDGPEIDTRKLELEADDTRDHDFDEDELHPLVATMTLDVENGDLDSTIVTEPPATHAGSLTGRERAARSDMPHLQRIAILTPAFCLLLGVGSAAIYFALSYAGAINLNADLGALPRYVGGPADVDTAEPDGQPFPLDSSAPKTPTPAPAAVARSTAPASSTPPSTPRLPQNAASPTAKDLAYPALKKAYAAWRSGDSDAAERHYREALRVAPRHPNALSGLGAVLSGSGRIDEAKPVYARLLALQPDNATAAAALLGGQDNGRANVREIRALIEHHPDSAPLYFALGSALADSSEWIEARVAFAAAFERAPARADYAFNLAVSLDRIGRYRDAESLYSRALELAANGQTLDQAVVLARLAELSSVSPESRP